jgi:hypothetical protein
MVSIVLFAVAVYLAITLGPIYYSNFNFENGVKTTASRAGARFFTDEMIVTEVLELARRNEIRIAKEDISVDRYAGQVHIVVRYSVPVDFIAFERSLDFKISASSFIGAL